MEKTNAVAAVAALAQDSRLDVYRLLVQAGPVSVASALKLAPNTLTFHLDPAARGGPRHRAARRPLDDLCGAL